ncbi:Unconventional myosin-VI like [Actinidia chinensis var. chinensis]|uniref:Unconventional myosin-VI like n=1 Tax=Actinidia chinensis var. chinensis TaxID=1590841 RepID=A0A2R6QHR0_ACTCC|nr:Unconventional myosin-VI like [Actinidia chinensis var. chinensis]
MANTSQVLDLEGLHREIHGMAEQMRLMNENNARLIQFLAAANPPPPAAPIPDVERSHRSRCSGNHSQNHSTGQEWRERRRSPSPALPRRERSLSSSESKSSSTTVRAEDGEVRRGRSPHQNDHARRQNIFTSKKIRDLDARLDAINTGTGIPVTVDTCDKVVVMAMMEGLVPGPLFDSLSKNVPETLFVLQNKADKYIAVEEMIEAKQMRRGKDDPKRKEPDSRRSEYRDEAKNKRSSRESKPTSERRPHTPLEDPN